MSESQDEEDLNNQAKENDVSRPPNKKQFEKDMELLQAQIKDKEAHLDQVKSAAAELKNLKSEKISTINKRKQIDVDLEKLNREIPEKMRQLNQLESSLSYKSDDKINISIQRLEWNLKAQRFKLSEEKKIVTEIDRLKRSKRTLVQFLSLRQDINALRDKQRQMRDERDRYYRAVNQIKSREESLRHLGSPAKADYSIIKQEIDELYEHKRQIVSDFKREKGMFLDSRDKQRRECWRKKKVERRSFVADRVRKWAQLEAERSPYENELRKCSSLIHHLSRLGASASLEHGMDSLSPASSQDLEPDLADEIDDGQYVLLRRPDTEGEDGGARRSSKKNRRLRRQSVMKKLHHTPDILEYFEELQLPPPTNMAEVSEVMEWLLTKKSYYERCDLQTSEVSSDAGVSATESAVCEMSRQASKTESCDGAGETTNPGDQVMADLLSHCHDNEDLESSTIADGRPNSTDNVTALVTKGTTLQSGETTELIGETTELIGETTEVTGGATGGGSFESDNSDTLSPQIDLAGESENCCTGEAVCMWSTGHCMGPRPDIAIADGNPSDSTEPQACAVPTVHVSKAWSSVVQTPKRTSTNELVVKGLEPSTLSITLSPVGGGDAVARRHSWKHQQSSGTQRHSTCAATPRSVNVPNQQSSGTQRHSTCAATRSVNVPNRLSLSTDSLVCQRKAKTPGPPDFPSCSFTYSHHLGHVPMQAARATAPQWPRHSPLSSSHSLPVNSLTLDNQEEFPPLTKPCRRGSSLSIKTSEGSLQEQTTLAERLSSSCTVSQLSPSFDTNPSAVGSPVHRTATHQGVSELTPTLATVAKARPPHLPPASVDKLSTERWVESSVVFTKDFCPGDNPKSNLTADSTRL